MLSNEKLWTSQIRLFNRPIELYPKRAAKLVESLVVLHNFMLTRKDKLECKHYFSIYSFLDDEFENNFFLPGLIQDQDDGDPRNAKGLRDQLCDYINGIGRN